MKDISLSRVGQLLIVIIGLLAAGCAGLPYIPPADMTPIPDTTGSLFLVFGEGALWSIQYEEKPGFRLEYYPWDFNYYVLRIDPETNKVVARVPIPPMIRGWPNSLDVGEGAVWVAFGGSPPKIYKIDPMTNRVVATIPVGPGDPLAFIRGTSSLSLAAGEGAVWAVRDTVLFRVDPGSNEVTSIPLSHNVDFVSVGAGAVWVRRSPGDAISRIDPRTHRLIATIPTRASLSIGSWETYLWGGSRWMTMGAGAIWVLLGRRIREEMPTMVGLLDPQSNQFIATIYVEAALSDIDARGAAIWAAAHDVKIEFGYLKQNSGNHSIVEIDSTTKTVKRKVPLGSGFPPKFLAVGADAVWVYLSDSGIYRLPLGGGPSPHK